MFHIRLEVPPIDIRLHHHERHDPRFMLEDIIHQIHALKEILMSALSDLQTAVTAQTTVIDSAVTLLQGLKTALDAAGTDQTALAALSADIGAKTQSLSDAVVANTPASAIP